MENNIPTFAPAGTDLLTAAEINLISALQNNPDLRQKINDLLIRPE